MFWLIAGCASQTPPSDGSPDRPLTLPENESPLQLSTAQETTLTEEEEKLFEDDLDELEEESDEVAAVADPLEWFNRGMFHFNDKLYFWVLKPVASGYRAITPQVMRTGVANFFKNLGAPVRLVNCVLQGKTQSAEAELAKFLYNSTIGLLGFVNPSKQHPKLNPDPEDFGQTLGSYGIGDGFYIVWPFLGPSTLRDSIGLAGDYLLTPTNYVDPAEFSLGLTVYDRVNATTFRIGDYESLKKLALDPYEALRNGYIQLQRSRIKK
jgi:phospholipid-binding lipoprotein MlaA